MIIKYTNHVQEELETQNRLREEIKNIRDNIKYIKGKAKVVTITRFKKAKDSLKNKQEQLNKSEEELVAFNKIVTDLKNNLLTAEGLTAKLQKELNKTAKIYEFTNVK